MSRSPMFDDYVTIVSVYMPMSDVDMLVYNVDVPVNNVDAVNYSILYKALTSSHLLCTLNYWRLGDLLYKKCSWRDFYLAVLSTVWKETHAYSLNGIHLICVIRQTAKLKSPPNIPCYIITLVVKFILGYQNIPIL